jgi:hypothetical protein
MICSSRITAARSHATKSAFPQLSLTTHKNLRLGAKFSLSRAGGDAVSNLRQYQADDDDCQS